MSSIEGGLGAIDKALSWIDRARGYLKPFGPETKSMRVNFRDTSAEVSVSLHVPTGTRRTLEKVVVPRNDGFQISEFLDETFSPVESMWHVEEDKWILDPKRLGLCEHYLLRLRGSLPRATIARFVRIQPARNRAQTEELDRYWLDTMIRDTEFVSRVWKQLQIEEVNLDVRVAVERPFSTAIPREVSDRLKETKEWVKAGMTGDRERIIHQMMRLRAAARSTKLTPEEIAETLFLMIRSEAFKKYLSVDRPYSLGEAKAVSDPTSIFPKFMTAEAFTDLNLKQSVATGYLAFERKKFEDELRRRFGS